MKRREKKSTLNAFSGGKEKQPPRISLEQYDQELIQAETEYQKGEYVRHEEFLKQIKKW